MTELSSLVTDNFEPMVTVHCFVADAQDALHVQAKYAVDEKKREIFFFR